MSIQFTYKKPHSSDILAPFIEIIVKNPLRDAKISIIALVDTGYDWSVSISEEDFFKIGLDEFELIEGDLSHAETYGGEKLSIRSAKAEIIFPGLRISTIDIIDAVKNAYEPLIGRKFLEDYLASLNGKEKTFEIQYLSEE